MSEKEKQIMEKLSNTIQKLDKEKQNYILGVAEGMAIVRDSENSDKEQALNRLTS